MRWLLGLIILTGGMFAWAYWNANRIVSNQEAHESIDAEVQSSSSEQSDSQASENDTSQAGNIPEPVIETVVPSTDEVEETPDSDVEESSQEEQSVDTPDANSNLTDTDSDADNAEEMADSEEYNVTSSFTGLASWYGAELAGNQTASGEIFDPSQLTAAHQTLPFDTMVRVTRLSNGNSVVVRINDRGPFTPGRVIDISQAAAEILGMIQDGEAEVRVDVLTSDIPSDSE